MTKVSVWLHFFNRLACSCGHEDRTDRRQRGDRARNRGRRLQVWSKETLVSVYQDFVSHPSYALQSVPNVAKHNDKPASCRRGMKDAEIETSSRI